MRIETGISRGTGGSARIWRRIALSLCAGGWILFGPPLHADETTDYTFAYRLYEEKDYETAKEEFDRFVATYPKSELADDSLYLSAESARLLGKADEAVRKFRQLERDYPQSVLRVDALHGVGRAWFEQGKFEEAVLAFDEAYQKTDDPRAKALAIFYTGESYYNLANYPRALEAYERLFEEFPNAPEVRTALYAKGWTLFQLKRYREAYDTLQDFIKRYKEGPEIPEAIFRAAECLFSLEEWDAAKTLYTSFAEGYKNDPAQKNLLSDAELRVGQCLFRLNKPDEARKQFERTIQLYPDLDSAPEAQYWIAEVLYETGNYPDAIYEYNRLLNAYPDSAVKDNALYSIGRAYFAQRDYPNAVKSFESVANLEKSELKDAAVWYIGESRRLSQDYNTAIIWYRRVPANSSYADDALMGQGACYLELGDSERAVETYKKLIDGKSSLRRDALYQLGIGYFYGKKFEEASQTFDNFLSEPKSAETLATDDAALYWQARSRYELKDYAGTTSSSRKLLDTYGNSQYVPDTLFYLAESLYWQKDYEGSRVAYDRLLKEHSASERAKQARYNVGWTHFAEAQRTNDPAAQQKAYQQAIQVWTELAKDPQAMKSYGGRALYDVGLAQLNLKKYDDAIRSFQDLVTRFPNDEFVDDARFRIAWTYYVKEDYDRALRGYEDLLKNHQSSPLIPEAIFGKGNAQFKKGRYKEAIVEYQQVISRFPTATLTETPGDGDAPHIREQAQYQVGESFYNMSEYRKAIEAYQTLQQLYPNSPLGDDAQLAIASAYQLLGDDELATNAYRELPKKYGSSPLAPEALRSIGTYYFDRKDYQQAVAQFQEVITKYKDSAAAPQAQYDIGRCYHQLKSYPQAVQAFEAVSQFAQASADVKASALYAAAFSLRDANNPRKDLGRSITLLKSLISQYPKSPEAPRAYLLIAETHRSTDKLDDAISAYRELIQAYPNSEEGKAAMVDLGNTLLRLKRWQDAITAFNPILDTSNKYSASLITNAHLGAGDAYAGLKKYDDAARTYLVLALVYPKQTPFGALQGLARAGDAYEKGGKNAQAIRWYEKAISDYSRHPNRAPEWAPFLDFAKNRLQALQVAKQ